MGSRKGESATVTVEITNGVTYAQEQTIILWFGGKAARGTDYTVSSDFFSLEAGESSVSSTVTAMDDTEWEDAETIVVNARHDGSLAGSATIVIAASDERSVEAALAALTLSGVDIGPFASDVTSYAGEVNFGVAATTVMATPADEDATVTIADADGSTAGRQQRVALGVGLNTISVTVTAEDGSTTETYTISVTRTAVDDEPGFGLDANESPRGIWSDGTNVWVADREERDLYAYRLDDWVPVPGRDIAVADVELSMGMWSDGVTLWLADLTGDVRAYRLADGKREADRDISTSANASPTGLWSDGTTLWVADYNGQTIYAYQLEDGERDAPRDIVAPVAEGISRMGIWSDGTTFWVADWIGGIKAYRTSDGSRDGTRDIQLAARNGDPTGLWSRRHGAAGHGGKQCEGVRVSDSGGGGHAAPAPVR